jgi:AcrR family transcriptional regulator
VNEVTVFRYFPQKQELYWQALEWKIRNSGLPADIRAVLDQATSPAGLIEGLLASVYTAVASDPSLPRLVQFAVMELEDERRMLFQLYLQPLLNGLIKRLEGWMAEGAIRRVDPVGAANSILGMILVQWSAVPAFDLQDEESVLTERVKLYADLCVRGLAN